MRLSKVIFLFVIFVAHKASSVLLTCCTRETNENGKKNSLFMKSCFATSCIIVYQPFSLYLHIHEVHAVFKLVLDLLLTEHQQPCILMLDILHTCIIFIIYDLYLRYCLTFSIKFVLI